MRSGSLAWGVLFLALGFGAAFLVSVARMGQERLHSETAATAYETALRSAHVDRSIPAPLDVEPEPSRFVEAPDVTIGEPPRFTTARYYYGKRRHRGPFEDADEWFPFVAIALAACGVIGFVRTRMARARG